MRIDERELLTDLRLTVRMGEMVRRSPDSRARPRHREEPPPVWSGFNFVLRSDAGEDQTARPLSGTIDRNHQAMAIANIRGGQGVFFQFDALKDGIVFAQFTGPPVNMRYGRSESALPIEPSIRVFVHPGVDSDFLSVVQLLWLHSGSLTAKQRDGIAERLQSFGATRVVTQGLVEVRAAGFFWRGDLAFDPQDPKIRRPSMVTALGNLQCGEAAQRYDSEELAAAFLAGDAPVVTPVARVLTSDDLLAETLGVPRTVT